MTSRLEVMNSLILMGLFTNSVVTMANLQASSLVLLVFVVTWVAIGAAWIVCVWGELHGRRMEKRDL